MAHKAADHQHTDPEVEKLRAAVNFMDCLSQGAFSEISSIAKLALAYMETPDGYRHPDNIAQALRAIWGNADDIQNCINSEAARVGCNYTDDAERRRWEAYRQAREAGVCGVRLADGINHRASECGCGAPAPGQG